MPSAPGGTPGRRESFTPEADSDVRLDSLVARELGLSRTQAATLIANGHVTVAGRREKASYKPMAGEEVVVAIPESAKRDVAGESLPLEIVFEDEQVLVVNKAAGMVVHPAPGNWTGTLVNALKGRGSPLAEAAGEDREGIVHRLDKDTSGLLLVAKTDRAHKALAQAMAQRKIVRRYVALAWGHLETDRVTVDRPLGRSPRDRRLMAIVSTGRAARTDFVRLARFDAADLLRAHLHTGRTHQIRVHLASIGHPVAGDDVYGGGGARRLLALPPKRHFLHAAWLIFPHPVTGESIDLRAPLPEDLVRSLAAAAGPDTPLHPDPLAQFGFYRLSD